MHLKPLPSSNLLCLFLQSPVFFLSRSIIKPEKKKVLVERKEKRKKNIYLRYKRWYKLLFRHLGLETQYFLSCCCCHCHFCGNRHVEVSGASGRFGCHWMHWDGKNGGKNGGHGSSRWGGWGDIPKKKKCWMRKIYKIKEKTYLCAHHLHTFRGRESQIEGVKKESWFWLTLEKDNSWICMNAWGCEYYAEGLAGEARPF